MFSYARRIVEEADKLAEAGAPIRPVLQKLRNLPLDDFGELMLMMPHSDFPSLSRMIPQMASPEVQQQWTGSDGYTLLRQTLSFVRTVSQAYAEIYGRSMAHSRVLDFGCGYGRILRLMYYYSDPSRIYGCDPWDKSIEACRQDGLLGHIEQSDYLPSNLPFTDQFDLIYAFSVFTHLSKRAAHSCLNTMTEYLASDGLMVITIRPIEYWDYDIRPGPEKLADLKEAHQREGFAYVPHGNIVADGEAVYGDTSIDFSYLEKHFPRLRIERFVRSLDDPYQIIVFLGKR